MAGILTRTWPDFSMPHVLLTRSEPALLDAVLAVLPQAQVHLLADPPQTLPGADWCFVDWLLDEMSGLEICRRLRAAPQTHASHITMVLEGDDPVARSRALAAGADDYMRGPLTPAALAERLRAYTGSQSEAAVPMRTCSGLMIDPVAHQVRWHGQMIPVSPHEFRLLELFLAHPDRLLSRTRIIALLGKEGMVGDERTVDVWVGRLRRILIAHGVGNALRTVRSLGYVFDTPVLDQRAATVAAAR
jgi:two-component system phosphate regulon response regulator PhoB